MKASGWKCVGEVKAASWHNEKRPRIHKGELIAKYKWEVASTDDLGKPRHLIKVPTDELHETELQAELFDTEV